LVLIAGPVYLFALLIVLAFSLKPDSGLWVVVFAILSTLAGFGVSMTTACMLFALSDPQGWAGYIEIVAGFGIALSLVAGLLALVLGRWLSRRGPLFTRRFWTAFVLSPGVGFGVLVLAPRF
jgi:hypothetical protein